MEKFKKIIRDGPRLPEYLMAGLSKEDAGRAHRPGRFDMGAGEGFSDSGSSTEKKHQKKKHGCGGRSELPDA